MQSGGQAILSKTRADVFIYVLQGHPGNDNVAKFVPEIVSCCTAAVPRSFTTSDAFGAALLPVCPPACLFTERFGARGALTWVVAAEGGSGATTQGVGAWAWLLMPTTQLAPSALAVKGSPGRAEPVPLSPSWHGDILMSACNQNKAPAFSTL